ncbi:MAG TPA: RNA polymerase sigma factor [Anaeromyxobacteraceae bacterium]|nr:RNA polymerase sigma factor [Anaeromyxobacteraceae bacterium]
MDVAGAFRSDPREADSLETGLERRNGHERGALGVGSRERLRAAGDLEGIGRRAGGVGGDVLGRGRRAGRIASGVNGHDRREPGRETGWSAAAAVALHRYVSRRVSNSADAADIAQQALLLAWGEREGHGRQHPQAWLFAIARHLVIDHYRARSRFRAVELSASLAETEPALQSRPDMAVAVAEGRQRLRALLDSMETRLCPEHQVAVLLADFHGLRDRHSAAVLRMTLPCFKLLLHGARARLRQFAGGNGTPGRTHPLRRGGDLEPDAALPGTPIAPAARRAATPSCRLGVTCRMCAPELLALRERLLRDVLAP